MVTNVNLLHTMTTSIPSKAAAVVIEYLGLLSRHGNWYVHGKVVLVVVGELCKRERHCLCKVVFGLT